VARASIVIAAACFVAAFAVAALATPGLTLANALFRVDPTLPGHLQTWVAQHLSPGVWRHIALPFLLRPAWMPLAMAGLVATGLAMTLGRPSRRR